ncbi:MAG: hypothetical protein IPM64_04550 [Phycisphaerales bacterium]|nr:hypothetical protein [Phycisphaerales bacterium]
MKILVACELTDDSLRQLRPLGSDLAYAPRLTTEELPASLADVGVLVVDGLRVRPSDIAGAAALQLIVRAGPGPANIAVEEASAQGVVVSHCPNNDAAAIAELAFGLMLALDRQIVESTDCLNKGRWARGEFLHARGLAGRTLGLLGYDRSSEAIARRARAFDMQVVAWTPQLGPDRDVDRDVEFCDWPREVARRSDVIVVLGAPEAEQHILVDDEFLEALSEGASLIHLAQPGVIDEAALARAVQTRGLRVALDVHSAAPTADSGKFKSRLMPAAGVIGTQHVGPHTQQARDAIAAEIVRIVRTFLINGDIVNGLNIAERSPAMWQLVCRVRDQVGVMASILDAIRADDINAQEISSRVFLGAKAALCTIALDERPSAAALDAVRAIPDVLHLELRAVV